MFRPRDLHTNTTIHCTYFPYVSASGFIKCICTIHTNIQYESQSLETPPPAFRVASLCGTVKLHGMRGGRPKTPWYQYICRAARAATLWGWMSFTSRPSAHWWGVFPGLCTLPKPRNVLILLRDLPCITWFALLLFWYALNKNFKILKRSQGSTQNTCHDPAAEFRYVVDYICTNTFKCFANNRSHY